MNMGGSCSELVLKTALWSSRILNLSVDGL